MWNGNGRPSRYSLQILPHFSYQPTPLNWPQIKALYKRQNNSVVCFVLFSLYVFRVQLEFQSFCSSKSFSVCCGHGLNFASWRRGPLTVTFNSGRDSVTTNSCLNLFASWQRLLVCSKVNQQNWQLWLSATALVYLRIALCWINWGYVSHFVADVGRGKELV